MLKYTFGILAALLYINPLISQTNQNIEISFGDTNSNKSLPISAFIGDFEPIYKVGNEFFYNIYYLEDGIMEQHYQLKYKIGEKIEGDDKLEVGYELSNLDKKKKVQRDEVQFIENDQLIMMEIPEIDNLEWLKATKNPSHNFLIGLLAKSGNPNLNLPGLNYKIPVQARIEKQYIDSALIIVDPEIEKVNCKTKDITNETMNCIQKVVKSISELGEIRIEYIIDLKKYGFMQLHYYFPNKEELIISLESTNF